MSSRPTIHSFDIFDTLIARSCLEAGKIHEVMEKKTGIAGFAQQRRAAEIAVSGRPYSLDDIYAEFGRLQELPTEVTDRLKLIEIETELAHVIPIADTMALVRDGDILVSDMYLGEAVIRRLLEKAGFRKNVGLYVSSNGKESGAVWPKLLEKFTIAQHMGDNKACDVDSPRAHGIAAKHVLTARLNELEGWLLKTGLRDIALLCREIRLTTPSIDPTRRQLQDLQTTLNFPMLLLACVPLARLVQQRSVTRVLFSSRDGELWMKLFRKFAEKIGLKCEIEYFYTSRLARRHPSPDYLAYARERLAGNTILLDLCGTGWSIAHLLKHCGIERGLVFMLVRGAAIAAYEKAAPTPDNCEFHSIIGPQDPTGGSSYLELLNAAPYGSMIDVKLVDQVVVPVVDKDSRHEETLDLVRCQVAVFERMIEAMDRYEIANLMTIDDKIATGISASLAKHVSNQHILGNLYMSVAITEDTDVCERLGCSEIYGNKT